MSNSGDLVGWADAINPSGSWTRAAALVPLGVGSIQGVRSVTFPSTLATPPAPLPLELLVEWHVIPRWPNGQGRLATNEESAGSTPARGA